MDNRGIPIVLPAKRSNTTKRTPQSTTPKRYDRPSSPFFIPSIKNELTLLEAYDTFSESWFLSRYQPTSDDFRCNVRGLYKSNLFTELQSPRPPKRIRSSNFTLETDAELPHLDTPKRSRIITISSPIEAKTPLGEDDLDLFEDSQLLSPPPGKFEYMSPTQHIDDILMKPTQEKTVAFVEFPLEHQPTSHNTVCEVPVEPSFRRLTRRQARLCKENGIKQEFSAPLPPPKKRGRAAKAKTTETSVDDNPKAEAEVIQQKAQDKIPKDAEPDTQQDPVAVEQEDDTHVAIELNEQGQVDDQGRNAVKEKTEDRRKIEEKMKEYMKRKGDAEIKTILENFPRLARYYKLVERAGSGTFSRVYKAKDLLVDEYKQSDREHRLASAVGDDADVNFVAIKLIFDISRPARVANEIRCLAALRSSPGVTPLITAFRHEALTFVVLPYIHFDHFDDFYRDMNADDVRSYISQLLIGLKSAHTKGLMHRDVKPGNFLYNVKTKKGYLADFGLATMSSVKNVNQNPVKSAKNSQYTQKGDQIGYYAYDS
ncbi:kinase-like domain-containing protein, partial [Parasitella parasitica]